MNTLFFAVKQPNQSHVCTGTTFRSGLAYPSYYTQGLHGGRGLTSHDSEQIEQNRNPISISVPYLKKLPINNEITYFHLQYFFKELSSANCKHETCTTRQNGKI